MIGRCSPGLALKCDNCSDTSIYLEYTVINRDLFFDQSGAFVFPFTHFSSGGLVAESVNHNEHSLGPGQESIEYMKISSDINDIKLPIYLLRWIEPDYSSYSLYNLSECFEIYEYQVSCAIVDGTDGIGLSLRGSPSTDGPRLDLLPEGLILTLLEDEAEEVNDFIWRKVQADPGRVGWVMDQFLKDEFLKYVSCR